MYLIMKVKHFVILIILILDIIGLIRIDISEQPDILDIICMGSLCISIGVILTYVIILILIHWDTKIFK